MEFNYKTRLIIILITAIIGLVLFFLIRLVTFSSFLFFLLILAIFYIWDKFWKGEFKKTHYSIAMLIAIFGFLLQNLNYYWQYYDKIFHFITPILISSLLYHTIKKIKIKKFYLLALVFFVTIGFLVIHEIAEFLLDLFFNLKLQGVFILTEAGYREFLSPITDTMIDSILGVVGSLVYCLTVLFFGKKRKRNN
jgi:hypothetical protein